MNKIKETHLWRSLIPALIVFVIVVVLGLMYQETLKETVLVTFQYILWLGGIFIKNLDQRYLWLQIVLVSLVLAFGLSSMFPSPLKKRNGDIIEEELPEKGRIEFWQYRISMYRSIRGRNTFILLDFPTLIIDTLALHERSDPKTIKANILSGKMQVPDEVYGIVAMEEVSTEEDEDTQAFLSGRNLLQRLSGRPNAAENAADARLEKVAAYLEHLLEDENDN